MEGRDFSLHYSPVRAFSVAGVHLVSAKPEIVTHGRRRTAEAM